MNVARLNVLITGDSKGAQLALAKARAATLAYARASNVTLLSSLKAATAGFAALGAQAAAGGVVELTNALLPLIGTIGLVPGAFAAAGAAAGAAMLAFGGLGDALMLLQDGLSDAQKKKAKDAFDGLATSAQHFVLTLKKLKPAFLDMQRSVQQNFFAGIGADVKQLAHVYLPIAQVGLSSLARTFSATAGEVTRFATSAATVGDLKGIFDQIRVSVANFTAGLVPLVQVFRDLTAVSSDFLPGLGSGFADVSKKLSAFVANARATGHLHTFIQDGVTAAKELGGVLGNVGGIIHGVFSAGPDGAGMLGALKTATQSIEDTVKSVSGQNALKEFFASAAEAGRIVGPVLSALLPVIGSLSTVMVSLGKGVATGLVSALDTLAPVLKSLVPAATTLGNSVGGALTQLATALPDVAGVLTSLVQAGAPLLVQFGTLAATLVKALAPAIEAVLPALSEGLQAIGDAFVRVLPELAPAFLAIAKAIAEVAPIAGDLIAQLVTGLAPILSQLVTALMPVLTQLFIAFAPVLQQLIASFLQVAQALAPLVMQLVQELAPILVQLAPHFANLVAAAGNFLAAVLPLLGPLIKLAGPVLGAVATELGLVADAVAFVLNVWADFYSAVWSQFGPLFNGIADAVGNVYIGFSNLVDGLRDLPAQIVGVFEDAGSWLFDAGKNILHGLLDGLQSMASAPVDLIKGIGGSMVDGFTGFFDIHSPSRLMHEMGGHVMAGLAGGITAGTPMVGAKWSDVNDLFKLQSPSFSPASIPGLGVPSAQTPVSAGSNGTVQITIDLRGTTAEAAKANGDAVVSSLSDLFRGGSVAVTQLRGRG